MVRYRMEPNEETKSVAREIALNSEKNIRKRKKMAPILFIVGIVELFVGGYFCVQGKSASGIAMVVIGVLMLLLGLKTKAFQRYVLKKGDKLWNRPFGTGTVEYVFDEDGIQINTQMGEGKNYWNAFKKHGVVGEYLYVQREDNKMIVIDRKDLSEEEIKELERLFSNIKSAHA